MPLFSKLSRSHKSAKPPTTPVKEPVKEPAKNPDSEAITALSSHTQALLTSLRDIRTDFYLVHANIRLFTPATPEKRALFKALWKDPRLRTDNEEWVAAQKAIPLVRKELSRVQERFAEKRAWVETAVKEEWKLRDTIMNGITTGEEEMVNTGFLEEVVEMAGWIQECKDECQLLAAEEKKIVEQFAELAKYQRATGGEKGRTGGVEGSEWVRRTRVGESSAMGTLAARESWWVVGDWWARAG
ncbi:hypothetical protein HOY82DRAFT_596684 [Tuber indicum]|nr:hypothetical protein HOY82DRAFT_596684 [Tuber indicum]